MTMREELTESDIKMKKDYYNNHSKNWISKTIISKLLKQTDENYPFICIRVNACDYYDFLCMCKDNGCQYEDGSQINPRFSLRCGYLMKISNDYKISSRHGISAQELNACWHFCYSDIRKGLYLPRKGTLLDLRWLTSFDGNYYFTDETIQGIILPNHLVKDINHLLKGINYKDGFKIYYCGSYNQFVKLKETIYMDVANNEKGKIRIIPFW